ncbi:MAG: hypothetical protein QF531_05790, partial [Candidatus Poseidonia sp.]|nr:hypothetical protein [Poseidonia sp.]
MSEAAIDLSWLVEAFAQRAEQEGDATSDLVSLAALKFTSDNIDVAKNITTEGLSDDERAAYVQTLSERASAEIFEFSTCNRVLYVGFGVDAQTLSSHISASNGIEHIAFELFEDTEAWRQLVKICSGLDSFMMGEL